jgi:hypothetical protein
VAQIVARNMLVEIDEILLQVGVIDLTVDPLIATNILLGLQQID